MLRLAGFSDVYLESQFTNGSQGMLFEKDIIYRTSNTTGGPEGRKLGSPIHTPQEGNTDIGDTFFGTDGDAYRLQWFVKNNQGRDDFSRIVDMNEAFRLGDDPAVSDEQWYATLDEVIDQDQWMRTFAMTRLAGLADFYTTPGNPDGGGWNHNFYNFVRPDDNKVIFLPWDMDSSFWGPSISLSLLGTERYRMTQVFELPANLRRYYGHFHDLITTTYNGNYTQYWAYHYAAMFGTDFSSPRSYVIQRGNWVMNQLNSLAPETPFQITTQGGEDFSVSESSVTLQGRAWYRVDEIRLAGHREALQPRWIDRDRWEITLPLSLGQNALALEAYDYQGNLMDTASINVSTTEGDTSHQLRISELMYNPSGSDALEFVEILNTSDTVSVDLAGVQFSDGISFVFSDGTLGPLQRIVVASDPVLFEATYGTGINVVGPPSSGQFSNSTERVALADATGITIHSFTYSDAWHPSTDGGGHSLTQVNELDLSADLDVSTSWKPSGAVDGTPGSGDTLSGDFNNDGLVDDTDIDLLFGAINTGSVDLLFDVNGDSSIDSTDTSFLVQTILGTSWGDGDLDGDVDTIDLTKAIINFTGAAGVGKTWSSGDTDGDGDVDTLDLTKAIINFTGALTHSSPRLLQPVFDSESQNSSVEVSADADHWTVASDESQPVKSRTEPSLLQQAIYPTPPSSAATSQNPDRLETELKNRLEKRTAVDTLIDQVQ